jgi:hypothetical protein
MAHRKMAYMRYIEIDKVRWAPGIHEILPAAVFA